MASVAVVPIAERTTFAVLEAKTAEGPSAIAVAAVEEKPVVETSVSAVVAAARSVEGRQAELPAVVEVVSEQQPVPDVYSSLSRHEQFRPPPTTPKRKLTDELLSKKNHKNNHKSQATTTDTKTYLITSHHQQLTNINGQPNRL